MYMVGWEGPPPPDKEEWLSIVRDVLMAYSGTYRLRFRPGPAGWRFDVECRQAPGQAELETIANSPDSVRFALYYALSRRGKAIDPAWE